MGYTIAQVRAQLTEYPGEPGSHYGDYLDSPLLKHFKAGVNAAWQENRPALDVAELRYEAKHGKAAGDAFTDGWVYSAAYM